MGPYRSTRPSGSRPGRAPRALRLPRAGRCASSAGCGPLSRCTRADRLVVLAAEVAADLRTAIRLLLAPLGATTSTAARSSAAGVTERSSSCGTDPVRRPTPPCRSPSRPAVGRSATRARDSRSACATRRSEVRATVQGAGAHLGRTQREPASISRCRGLPGRIGEPLTLGGVGLLVGDVLGGAARRASRSASPARARTAGLLGAAGESPCSARPRPSAAPTSRPAS